MSAKMSNGKERRLRSKDQTNKPVHQMFTFENANVLISQNKPLLVSNDSKCDFPYHYFDDSGFPPVSKTSKSTNLQIIDQLLPRRNKSKADALPDERYKAFHRKMQKEEKSMTNSDKLKIMSDLDHLRTYLSLIQQYDWIRHLPQVTYINDMRDYEELSSKRSLTIDEIQRILRKHDDWKKRQEILHDDIKKFDAGLDSDDDDSSILSVPLNKLQEEREASRLKKHGPIIRLNLRNGYELFASPYEVPRIVQAGTEYRADLSVPLQPKSVSSSTGTTNTPESQLSSKKSIPRTKANTDLRKKASISKKSSKTPIKHQKATPKPLKHEKFTTVNISPETSSSDDEISSQGEWSQEDDPLVFTEFLKPVPRQRGRPTNKPSILVRMPQESLHIQSDPAKNMAFGQLLPELSESSFEKYLPVCWKVDLPASKSERTKLRGSLKGKNVQNRARGRSNTNDLVA